MKSFGSRRWGWMCCLLVLVAGVCTPLTAQAPFNVYVSTGSGQQILQFDSESGAVTGVCDISPAVPEDVVVGPDGNLYVADTSGNRIYRVPAPIPTPASTAASCGAVAVYDHNVTPSSCTVAGQADQPCPTGPEGPSFLRINTLDLYFNAHGSGGIWKIPAVANAANSACAAGSCPTPVQLFANGSSGEGLDFDIFGKLLSVDQGGNAVIRATVSCLTAPNGPGCPTSNFISNLSSPVGIAINTCGDILVASGSALGRYNSSTGAFLDSRTFSGNNTPRFLEVDSGNRIFLVTSQDEAGKNATFWRLDPPAANPLSSCALGSFTTAKSIAIKTNLAAGIASGNGLGLGVAASQVAITQNFSKNHHSNIYNFGAQHSFTVTCNNVTSNFGLTVTAVKSKPTDAATSEVNFLDPFPAVTNDQCPTTLTDPQCLHYGGQHGFCTQYVETTVDNSDVDTHCAVSSSGQFSFFVTFSSAEPVGDPGGAHTTTDPVNGVTTYNECQSQHFYPQQTTGDPVTLRGSNSHHVVFNAVDSQGVITLNSPISSCGSLANCNPQFNIGQNVNVKFTLLQNGSPNSNATEQLSIARIRHTTKGVVTDEFVPQTVVATKASNVLNFFNPNSSGQYSYNDDSSAFDKLPKGSTAVYQYTIWGNGADPFSFLVSGTF